MAAKRGRTGRQSVGRQKRASPRERKVAAGLAAGLSERQAAVQAGYAVTTATKKGYAIADRPVVRSLMTEALEKIAAKGDIVEMAAQCVVDSLGAERTLVVPQGRFAPATIEKTPDHDIRLKGVDRIINAYGFIPTKLEMPAPARPPIAIHFHLRTSGQQSKPKPMSVVDGKPAAPITMTQKKPFKFTFSATGKKSNDGNNGKGDEHHG